MAHPDPWPVAAAALTLAALSCAARDAEPAGSAGADALEGGAGAPGASPEQEVEQRIELGAVDWRRVEAGGDFDRVLAEAGSTHRPVLLLFQEIPG